MKKTQTGFTLIELAIVLVIIGLLLGGVLKGQELINSAKVKNFASDFRNIPVYLYGYQDKFRSIPGDDAKAKDHVGAGEADVGNGNGQLEGRWNDAPSNKSEASMFWLHARLGGFAQGATSLTVTDYYPRNADGGNIGFEAGRLTEPAIKGLKGTYVICSKGILGKYVKQLDLTMDNDDPATGSMMATPSEGYAVNAEPTATKDIVEGQSYVVCLAV
jgi:prepilin-type N-terminal cleavage/methylation domain-containing protein